MVEMRASMLLLAVLASVHADYDVDGSKPTYAYDGHGALSAGASSRLLIDYPEPQRTQILDLLFKPNYGAAMHMIKVEIGGDGQSTDGTEASHMHYRDDLSCNRGYEFWLLQEARARNPKIQTYALSWASPHWVGNQTGYYSQDEIDYHMKWLECTKQWDIGSIDYIGNWNERPWGTADWTKQYRAAMDSIGFKETKIIIPDGGDNRDIKTAADSDPAFEAAVAGIGLHYPCNHPDELIEQKYGWKYWSSEDYSTVGNWAGAACWGRALNQNFVRMNMTSTIAWSLIWSVYGEGFPYFGNGLMYAMTPWSGYYEAGDLGAAGSSANGAAIWTNAQHCQFIEVGWRYLAAGHGSGFLAAESGGSYTTLISPGGNDFSIIIEKLEGRCLRCAGQVTTAESATFTLRGGLEKVSTLQMWSTNETHHFVSHGNITVGPDGSFTVPVGKDSIVTVSSWFNGQSKAQLATPIPANTPFPTTYADDFDSYPIDYEAKYFADNGGSFQIAANPIGAGKVMKQWAKNENGVNRWGGNVNPISLIGNASWCDMHVEVAVLLDQTAPPPPPPPPAPPPAPPSQFYNWQNKFNSQCLDVKGGAGVGAAIDTWSCVSKFNEQFAYDATSGQFVANYNDKDYCMSTACAASTPTTPALCMQKCSGSSPLDLWVAEAADGTIRPKAAPTSCLFVASKTLDATLGLQPCSTPPTAMQQWSKTSSPAPGPAPNPDTPYAGLCIRTDRNGNGDCLLLDSSGAWSIGATAKGKISKDPSKEWVRLGLVAVGLNITVMVDGAVVGSAVGGCASGGMVSINSGFNVAYFDNFTLTDASVEG